MRGRPARFEAAALVDGNVDEYGAAVHVLDVLLRHQLRCRRTGDQHGTNHEIGLRNQFVDGVLGRVDRVNTTAPVVVDLA